MAILIAIFIVILIVVSANRRGSRGVDEPDDRGPYSAAMAARSDFAALGTTIDKPPGSDPREAPDPEEGGPTPGR